MQARKAISLRPQNPTVRIRPVQDGDAPPPVTNAVDKPALGRILIEDEAVDSRNLMRALVIQQRQATPLADILLSHGWVTPSALASALSRQWRVSIVDLDASPPDPRMIDQLGAGFCLQNLIVPWRQIGGITYVATARPDAFSQFEQRLANVLGPVRMLICHERDACRAVLKLRRTALIRQAETRVPPEESCRTRSEANTARIAGLLIGAALLGLLLMPLTVIAVITVWAVLTLVASTALKALSFYAILRRRSEDRRVARAVGEGQIARPGMDSPLPLISVMVPMFSEPEIAEKLIGRLSRLDYPRELMDILIVIEESDRITSDALRDVSLPHWLRVVKVPDGPVRTKPRALNYALNFCRGSIIGVWDAEDRPEPDQLHKVARRFHFADPKVACLQGVLDFYNPRTNWLARAFTIEYASWFRGTLAGAAALDLVVPLGGTTLFFRRHALEEVGCWDAWNVTEDADLGVRLTRRGYRTEMLDTTTHEEANCRLVPWVKQRSRWLKGFVMTWGVHMRRPGKLWRELGAKRFIGLQIQLFAAVSQYLMAPVLWSFWLLLLGLPHPIRGMLEGGLGGNAIAVLFSLFALSEMLNIAIGLWATSGPAHRHLMRWVPTMHLYYPLGCLAAWKAIYEVIVKPFYWDKTQHGVFDASHEEPPPSSSASSALIPLAGALPDAANAQSLPVLGKVG